MQIADERDFLIRKWSDLDDLDWYILGPFIALVLCGLLLLKSAESGAYLSRQIMFLFPSLLIGMFILFIRIKFFNEISLWIYFINIFLLLIVLVKGASVMGAQRWLDLGIIKIQPSEIAKIAVIISLASWFCRHPVKNYFDLFVSLLIVLMPFLLVFKQPDLGTSLAFLVIYFAMAYWAGASITHLLVVLSPALSLLSNATGKVMLSMGVIQFNNRVVELTLTQPFVFLLFFF